MTYWTRSLGVARFGPSFYLKRQYRLRLRASPEVRPLTLRAGWLELPVPPSMAGPQQAAYARAALMDWYTKRAREPLPVSAESWGELLYSPARCSGQLTSASGARVAVPLEVEGRDAPNAAAKELAVWLRGRMLSRREAMRAKGARVP